MNDVRLERFWHQRISENVNVKTHLNVLARMKTARHGTIVLLFGFFSLAMKGICMKLLLLT